MNGYYDRDPRFVKLISTIADAPELVAEKLVDAQELYEKFADKFHETCTKVEELEETDTDYETLKPFYEANEKAAKEFQGVEELVKALEELENLVDSANEILYWINKDYPEL